MAALIITLLAGGVVGWLSHGHLWRAFALSVLTSAACFGVAWWLKGESQEILIKWMESQFGFQVLAYILGFFLPCACAATVAAALHRNINREKNA
jgi:hypothetical protein